MSSRRARFSANLVCAVGAALTCPEAFAAVTLDPTFAGDGVASVSLASAPNLRQVGRAVAVDADGRVILAATVQTLVGLHLYSLQPGLARLGTDGTHEALWHAGLTACPSETGPRDAQLANVIAIQADGRILIAGTCSLGDQAFVARILPSGAIDRSFGIEGIVQIPLPPRPGFLGCCARAHAVVAQPDGRILVAGAATVGAAVWRLESNGAIDTTFADSGVHALEANSEYRALELMSDGRIVAVGTIEFVAPGSGAPNANLLVTRLLPTGEIDTTFNGGVQSINVGTWPAGSDPEAPTQDAINGVALRADGEVVVAVKSSGAGSLVAQFTVDGLLDADFGENGYAYIGDASTTALDLALMGNGDTVVVGAMPITQLSPTGDESIVHQGAYEASAIVRDGDDKVVLALTRGMLTFDISAARFVLTPITPADSTPDPFDFVDVANVELDTRMNSASVTISGLTVAAPVSVGGGEYAIGCADPWRGEGSAAVVMNGQTVCVRHFSAVASLTGVETVLTIGGVSGSFRSTTGDADPDPFAFAGKPGVKRATTLVAGPVLITGITIAAPVTISGGEFSVGCGSIYSNVPATVRNGQVICVQHRSSTQRSSVTRTTLSVGNQSVIFWSTTRGGGAIDWLMVAALIAVAVMPYGSRCLAALRVTRK